MDLPEEHSQGDRSAPPCVAQLLRLGHHKAPGGVHLQLNELVIRCQTKSKSECLTGGVPIRFAPGYSVAVGVRVFDNAFLAFALTAQFHWVWPSGACGELFRV